MDLPPGAVMRGGRIVRVKEIPTPDGKVRTQVRPVSLDPREAKEKRMDYYHPELGWVLEGYKLEKDRPEQSIMDDDSQALGAPDEFSEKEER